MIILPGILLGLAAACSFSFSFLGSRVFYEKSARSPFQLLTLSYMQMGIFSLCLFPFVWPNNPLSWNILPPLAGIVFFAMSGQLAFFLALKYAQSSQVTPLLALKILMLAFGSLILLNRNLSLLQWLSVVICFTATLMLNFSGGRLPVKGLLCVVLTCCAYALADISVTLLIRRLEVLDIAHPALLAVCLTYAASGLVGVLLAIKIGHDVFLIRSWKFALYFSVPYFFADICLFTTFKLVGPVFANILLSTRGISSILLAKIVARKNMHYLEEPVTTAVTIRRLLAAGLFTIAIALYVLG
jgi:drug/metabolite transporter (DMT)-like permease